MSTLVPKGWSGQRVDGPNELKSSKMIERVIAMYGLAVALPDGDEVSAHRQLISEILIDTLSPRQRQSYLYVKQAGHEVPSSELAQHLGCAHIDASIILKKLTDYRLLLRRRDQYHSSRWVYALPDLLKEEKKPHRFKRRDGYVFVSTPGHPRARGWNDHVQEHIIVMEKHIGRYLQDREVVHHKNGIRHDNRIENLELWVRPHPPGQRVSDLVEWATEFLREYAPERLVKGDRVGGSRDE